MTSVHKPKRPNWSKGNQYMQPKKLSANDKSWIGYQIAENVITPEYFFKKIGIPQRSSGRYAFKYSDNQIFHEECGRPFCLDEDNILEVRSMYENVKLNPTEAEIIGKVQALHAKNYSGRTGIAASSGSVLCRTTFRRVCIGSC